MQWSVVVPVKRLERAKTRLSGVVPGRGHEALVLALAADTVTAVLAAPAVARVIVVTDDARAAAELGDLGALVVPDLPDSGLNPALDHGAGAAAAAGPADGVAVVGADRPALRPAELTAVLGLASGHDRSFLPDAAGTGTALLAARPGVPLWPRFGAGSAAAHTASGAVRLGGEWASLRHDTDTAADLGVARRLGVGARTGAVLAAFSGRQLSAAGCSGGRVARMQGTVAEFDRETEAGRVLLDDGSAVAFPPDAFAAGGLRFLRPGQRVRLETADDGTVTLVTLATFH